MRDFTGLQNIPEKRSGIWNNLDRSVNESVFKKASATYAYIRTDENKKTNAKNSSAVSKPDVSMLFSPSHMKSQIQDKYYVSERAMLCTTGTHIALHSWYTAMLLKFSLKDQKKKGHRV